MNILVIDIGSSSVRALLFDSELRLIPDAHAAIAYQLDTTQLGQATLDPLSLRSAVERIIDTVLQHPQARNIGAVAMATLVGNLMGVDIRGLPTTPIFSYADTRCIDSLPQLRVQVDPQIAHQRTGCPIHTAYHPAKLAWIREIQPEIWKKTIQWIDFASYLYWSWFNVTTCSYSVASWSGLLNRHSLTWDEPWLQTLGLSAHQLPVLNDYDTRLISLTKQYAERWSVLKNIPFFLAVGDGAAANVGSGCIDSNKVALTLGTTGAIRTAFHGHPPALSPAIWNYRIDKTIQLIGGATSEGGNIAAWLRQLFNIDDVTIEYILQSSEPDSHGLTVLPMLIGERSPGWHADALGFIDGLRLSTSSAHIVQAFLEAVALRLAVIFEQLQPYIAHDAIVIGGGGAIIGSPAWTQIIADALDRPIHVADELEVTARGAAMLVLKSIRSIKLSDYSPTIKTIIQPRADVVTRLTAARKRQSALYTRHYSQLDL